jgi:DNA-binding transcriptional MerR regulator
LTVAAFMTDLYSRPVNHRSIRPKGKPAKGADMVRKRDAYTRWRSKRTRPKSPAPKNGWRIAELSQLSQVPVRRLRHYIDLNLLEPLEFRGTATRYPRRALLRLLATLRLRAESRFGLTEIKRKLDALGDNELQAWLQSGPLTPAAAAALGLASPTPAAVSGTDHTRSTRGNHGKADTTQPTPLCASSSTWQRIVLLPGLELMISSEASPVVRRAAQSICAEYVGNSDQALASPQ